MLHAGKRIPAFLLTGDHLHLKADLLANAAAEVRPVARLPNGTRRNHPEAFRLKPRSNLLKGVEGGDRLLHRLLIEIAVEADGTTKPCRLPLLVENAVVAAPNGLRNDQPDAVGTDVDCCQTAGEVGGEKPLLIRINAHVRSRYDGGRQRAMIASAVVDQVRRSRSSKVRNLPPNLPAMSSRELPDLPPATIFAQASAGESPRSEVSVAPAESATTATQPRRVVAVGNFDGVHIGHAAIIAQLRQMASRLSAEAVVLTFDPHPATLVRPESAPVPLSTAARRAELLLGLGVDQVFVQPMVKPLVDLSAPAFFEHVLCERLGAVGLVEGIDFRFGRGREGDVSMLARLCADGGLACDIVAPIRVGDEIVSSSRVRSLIAAGEVGRATSLLTAPYRVSGTVIEGAKRGRTLGFPTANLADIATLLPAPGVYAAEVVIDGRDTAPPGGPTPSAAAVHIGANVSFGETTLSVEAHLIDFTGDLYGRTLHVDFLQRLRETRIFDSREALVSQLTTDVRQAADLCSAKGPASPPTFLSPPEFHAS